MCHGDEPFPRGGFGSRRCARTVLTGRYTAVGGGRSGGFSRSLPGESLLWSEAKLSADPVNGGGLVAAPDARLLASATDSLSTPALESIVAGDPPRSPTIERLGADPLATEQAIGLDTLDPGSRYALEHSGLGPTDVFVDAAGLVASGLLVSLAAGINAITVGHGALFAFVTTFVRMAVAIPVLTAVLGSTRRRSLLLPVFSDQVHALALPLAAGGLLVLTMWRLLVAVLGIIPPRLDWVLLNCAFALPCVAAMRVLHFRPRKGRPGRVHKVLIVGSGSVADRVSHQMDEAPGVEVVGYVDDDPMDPSRCIGRLGDLNEVCERESVSHLVVAFSRSQPHEIIDALRPLQGRLPITVIPRLFDVLPTSAKVHELGSGLAGLSVAPAALGRGPRAIKLTMDLCASAMALLLLSPLLLLVSAVVRLTSRGPVLFKQTRIGRNGKEFTVFKFRTMSVQQSSAEAVAPEGETVAGPFRKLKNDPRVTPLGKVLRKTSIDELPQLWNVLRGEMSLVGPRPFMVEDAASINGWALRRYSVKPGITGLWQVSGRNDLTFAEMCRLDQLYVNCWSIGLDVRILLRTLWVVFGGRGAY